MYLVNESRKPTPADFALLASIILIAAALQLPTVTLDLPYVHHPDEPTNLGVLHAMMSSRTANPEFFNYPSLMFYLNAPGQYLAQLMSEGPIDLHVQAMGSVYAPAPVAIVLARATSMLAHAITTALVFTFLLPRVGRALAGSAALLAATSPLTVSYSTWVAPDVFATLFVVIALIASVRIVETGRAGAYILAGIMGGFAAATKYNTGFVVVAIAAAAVLAPGDPSLRIRLLARAAICSILALIAGSPYLLLDTGSAISGFLFELQHYKTGHPGAEGEALAFNLKRVLTGLGAACVLLLGTLRRREMWPILVFIIGYFFLLSAQTVRFERNLAPLVPALACLASIGASELLKSRLSGIIPRRTGVIILSAVIVLPSIWMTVRLASVKPDLHAAERAWIETVIPGDASVVVEAYTPFLEARDRDIDAVYFAFTNDWAHLSPSFLVLSSRASQRFQQDPRTLSAFAKWEDDLESKACRVMSYGSEKKWRIKVFDFDCT